MKEDSSSLILIPVSTFFITFTPSSFLQTFLIFLPPPFLLSLNSFKLRRKIVVPIFSPSSYTIFMLSVFPLPSFFLFPTCLKTKNRWHRLLPLPTPFIITHNFQLIPPTPLPPLLGILLSFIQHSAVKSKISTHKERSMYYYKNFIVNFIFRRGI